MTETPGPAAAPAARPDVVCLGESMVTFAPSRPGPLADVPSFHRGIGGAESNVACTLARSGHATRWISRVGTDGFGDHLLATIAASGVDISAVQRDPHRPTGVYFRTAGNRATAPASGPAVGRAGSPAAGVPGGRADGRADDPHNRRRADGRDHDPHDRPDGDGAADGPHPGRDGAHGHDPAGGSPHNRRRAAGQDPGPGGAPRDRPADPQEAGEVVYYRTGSAASALSPSLVRREDVWAGRVVHLTGITAALSGSCRALMRRLTAREPGRPLLSFDVNHRPALGRGADPRVLADLARRCDLVFVGEDEAEGAWGLPDADAIRAALPEPRTLVVKQGGAGATVFSGKERLYVPAPAVEVVAHVGAGDAFAAGFLSATLRGLPLRDRLRHGHLLAAAALTVPGDLAVPPPRAHVDALAALDDAAWGRLRLEAGWTEEAR